MKILPLVKEMQNDITSSGIRLRKATADGYNIADRTSKIYKQGPFKKYYNVTRSVTNKVVLGTTRQELPYVAGAIGMIIPIPFISPILFCLGLLASYSGTGAALMYDKISRSHHFCINHNEITDV